MHSQFIDKQSVDVEESSLNATVSLTKTDSLVTQTPPSSSEPTQFHSHFQDCMEMHAEVEQVTNYLDDHQNWFSHCAEPMKVEPIGANGYAIVVGKFGALGYELEPKIGLELLPQDNGIYRIRSIPVPNYVPSGYEVDFHASQSFVEVAANKYFQCQEENSKNQPKTITLVEWDLDLRVSINFPRFIQRLPQSLIQKTGDGLLHQIVRQVSRRLTYKVQEHFHTSLGLPIPQKSKK